MTNALLSVTRVEGSDEPTIRMRVRCASSRVEFCKIEMTLEEFALLITGVSEVPVDATYKDLDKVGMAMVTLRTGHSLSGESLVEGCTMEDFMQANAPKRPQLVRTPVLRTLAQTPHANGTRRLEWEKAEWYAPRNPADPGVILIPSYDVFYAETTYAKVPNDKDSPST